jgi:hypothetical protein
MHTCIPGRKCLVDLVDARARARLALEHGHPELVVAELGVRLVAPLEGLAEDGNIDRGREEGDGAASPAGA